MSKISSMMDIGKRSLSNNQTALTTVSHNIANKATEGFSRQRVEILSSPPNSPGQLQVGTGSRAGMITRTNNPWLEKQIQREGTNMGYSDARAEAMGRLEQVYNEQQNKGLNQYMTDFFNGVRELSANPESLSGRTMVREAAVSLTGDFGRVVDQLKTVQTDLDNQIKTTVDEVNQITKEIAGLNQKIKLVEVQGVPSNDERDRRDLLLKKLGEKLEVNWAEGTDGMVSVTAGKAAVLVSGIDSLDLKAMNADKKDHVQIFYATSEHGTEFNMTDHFRGGRIGASLEVRDEVVQDLLGHVDNLAHSFATEVNNLHAQGFDRYNNQGADFFDIPDQVEGAAENIKINQDIYNDVGRIAVAAHPDSPGDNTVANMIASLQHRKVMEDGSSSFDDYYNTQVGQIGTIASRAMKSQESQRNVIQQLGNLRESISGVSLDEETTKMIEYQKAYDASARLIRTADEMFDTILNLKR
jgi:flagellar hook-associated protein 1 FlgK